MKSSLHQALLCGILATGVSASPALFADTTYTSAANGDWSASSTWTGGQVPNDRADALVSITNNVTVTGSFEAKRLTVQGQLGISGAGNGLTLGSDGNGIGLRIQGWGSYVVSVSDGASLVSSGDLYLGEGTPSGSLRTPTLELTNATASFNRLRFNNGNATVSPKIILNEGAQLTASSVLAASNGGGTLVFNGGATGFGSLELVTMTANYIPKLEINSGAFVGTGNFTLIDAANWSASFDSILLNGGAYTLGTSVLIGEHNWSVDLLGTNLVLQVQAIPETSTTVIAISAAVLAVVFVRRSRLAAKAGKRS